MSSSEEWTTTSSPGASSSRRSCCSARASHRSCAVPGREAERDEPPFRGRLALAGEHQERVQEAREMLQISCSAAAEALAFELHAVRLRGRGLQPQAQPGQRRPGAGGTVFAIGLALGRKDDAQPLRHVVEGDGDFSLLGRALDLGARGEVAFFHSSRRVSQPAERTRERVGQEPCEHETDRECRGSDPRPGRGGWRRTRSLTAPTLCVTRTAPTIWPPFVTGTAVKSRSSPSAWRCAARPEPCGRQARCGSRGRVENERAAPPAESTRMSPLESTTITRAPRSDAALRASRRSWARLSIDPAAWAATMCAWPAASFRTSASTLRARFSASGTMSATRIRR